MKTLHQTPSAVPVRPRRGTDAPRAMAVLANLSLKVAAAGVAFVVSVVVARQLGLAEAGLFFFAQNIMVLLIATSRFGLDNSVLRTAARLDLALDRDRLQAVFSTATTLAVAAALVVAGVVVSLAWAGQHSGLLAPQGYGAVTSILVAGLPFLAFAATTGFVLQATNHVTASTFLVFAAQPVIHLVLLLALGPQGAATAAWLFVASSVAAAACAATLARHLLGGLSLKPRFRAFSAETLQGIGSLWGVSLVNQAIALLPVLMLSFYATPVEVALFAIALRVAGLAGNIVVAVNSVFAPRIARQLSANRREAFRSTRAAQAYTFAIGAPLLAVPLAFPGHVLALFGSGFDDATLALVILVLGQMFNIATSTTSILLAMGGAERAMLRAGAFTFSLGLVGSVALVPHWPLTGSSLVSAFCLIMLNGLYLWHALRPLAANPDSKSG